MSWAAGLSPWRRQQSIQTLGAMEFSLSGRHEVFGRGRPCLRKLPTALTGEGLLLASQALRLPFRHAARIAAAAAVKTHVLAVA